MSVRSPVRGHPQGSRSRPAARWGSQFATPAHLAVIALTGLAAGLRFYGLGHQGFWFDEANTAQLVHFSPGQMLGLIPQTESTPPLYYGLAWIWTRVFGHDEAGLRSLSALAGVIVVPVAYAAAAKLISRRAGLITAALLACNPFLIWYSQEARSYELLVLLSSVALLTFIYARSEPSPRALAAWTIASALALATHYYAVLAIVPQAAWLLFEHRRRRGVQVAVGLVGLCGLALIPLALSQHGTGHDSWIAHLPLRLRLAQVLPQFLIGTGAPARTLLKFAALALALAALGLLAFRARAPERRAALVPGGLALAGFGLSLALLVAGFDDLITRNIIVLLVPAAMLVAGGLAVSRAAWAGVAVTGALCAIGVSAAVGVAAERNLQRPDWRPVARALGARPATAGRAILIQRYGSRLPLSLYLPHLKFLPRAGALVRELDVIAIGTAQQPLCWWGAACNLVPSTLQTRYAIPGFHPAGRGQVLQFTITRLVSDRPRRLTRAAVAAALTPIRRRHDALLVQRP